MDVSAEQKYRDMEREIHDLRSLLSRAQGVDLFIGSIDPSLLAGGGFIDTKRMEERLKLLEAVRPCSWFIQKFGLESHEKFREFFPINSETEALLISWDDAEKGYYISTVITQPWTPSSEPEIQVLLQPTSYKANFMFQWTRTNLERKTQQQVLLAYLPRNPVTGKDCVLMAQQEVEWEFRWRFGEDGLSW